jgi:hypothetical protein
MKSNRPFNRNRLASHLRIAGAVTLLSAAAAMAFVAAKTSTSTSHVASTSRAKISMNAFRARHGDVFETSLGATRSGEPDPSAKGADVSKKISEAIKKIHNGHAQQLYSDQAYPSEFIEPAQQIAAANAAQQIASLAPLLAGPWAALGPNGVSADALVASESTPASIGTVYSGRATAIAVSPTCVPGNCALFLGAAGGGVWKTPDALAATPTWSQVSDAAGTGIPSNAIGSIAFDPSNPSMIYVGTGEPNGSSDSEAGVGLFKSTDGGSHWSLVAGSTAKNAPCQSNPASFTCAVATGRSIGAIAVDPADPTHIFIGTDVARHGSSSVNGGRFTPPGSALVGLYESTNGGASFAVAKIVNPQDTVNPASPNGGDFFRGGCSHIELYRRPVPPATETEVYASFFDFGIFRRSSTQDGNSIFNQIFKSQGGGSLGNSSIFRTEFSLAPISSGPPPRPLRIYVGDGGLGQTPQNGVVTGIEAQFYKVDNANVAAATLFTGGTNGGWTTLSSSDITQPGGFASFNYCTGQCSYDMPVWSPPGSPDIVYIGGASQYGELGQRSNGRDVQRSQDAGASFTDMTADATGTGNQPGIALHPDQHALATAPGLPNTLFIADDGGLWRVNGDAGGVGNGFFDMSGQCASRSSIHTAADLNLCQNWLKKVPATITSMNAGLETLQYQSLSVNTHTTNDIMGGTQDNGTHASNPGNFNVNSWFVSIFGDGGQSGVNNATGGNPETRMHTFFNAQGLSQIDVNFRFNSSPFLFGFPGNETGWNWIGDPGSLSNENMSFYIPLISDPKVADTWFFGAQHVWRTQDNGGNQAFLETNCSEFVNGLQFTGACGDWVPLGKDLTGTNFGKDKQPGPTGYVVATVRAPSDTGTLWVGLRRGRVFIASNADKPSASVTFYRIDTSATPTRFVSGIAVDPADPNHAFISFSGYNAYNPTQPGHVFDVHYNTSGHTATFTNIDGDLGDQPITGIAFDSATGNLFVSTDFGVLARSGSSWVPAASDLPPVAVYGLTLDSVNRVLYAATHGRSAYRLSLGP